MKGRELADRFDRKRMFQVALAVLRNRQEAEDAVQEAIVGLLDRDLDPDPLKFNAYACHCVRHRAIEQWRRTQGGIQKLMAAMPSEDVLSTSDIHGELESRFLARKILRSLAKESPEDRLCVTQPPHVAAAQLGIPIGTAKSRGFRVRNRIRARIDAEGSQLP